jgi:hypothetical protein
VNSVASFFGTRAGVVLALYRRAAADAQAVEQLAERLGALCRERDELHLRSDAEIEQRTVRLAECTAKLEELQRRIARLNAMRDQLSLALSSLWRRFGITLRRWFASRSPSVGELQDRLRHLSRAARKAEEQADKLAGEKLRQAAQLRRLTVPLESVEYAISYLEQFQRTYGNRVNAHRCAVETEIRAAVRASSLPLLRSKLNALPATIERRALAVRVMRLKTLLLEQREEPDEPPLAELAGDGTKRLMQAVEAGFSVAAISGDGQLTLRGQGHKHVRRKRTGPLALGSGRHGSRPANRAESTWERVPVELAGQLPVALEIRRRGWRAQPVIDALRSEAQLWFRIGAMREAAAEGREETACETDELIEEIREILESAATFSPIGLSFKLHGLRRSEFDGEKSRFAENHEI